MAPRRNRRSRLVVVAVVAGVLLSAWVVIVVISMASATSDLNDGRRAVDAARHREPRALLDESTEKVLQAANRRFSAARDTIRSPLLLPAKLLPVLGRNLRSVEALSNTATRITTVGIDGLQEARTLLRRPAAQGESRVALVREVGELANRTQKRLTNLDLGPGDGLFGSLGKARADLARGQADLTRALTGASATATTLGNLLAGPSRYLLVGANNAEMRAGSGMFLSLGELEAHDGVIRLGDVRSVTDADVPTGVAVSGDMAERWGWLTPGKVWQNLMLSPRFDESARLAAQMWVAAGNGPVDGVLAIDPAGLKEILKVTGPVTLGDIQVDSENVVEELVYRQYARFVGDQAERREELGLIARSAFDSLEAGGYSSVDLIGGLAKAIAGRHLMAWSSQPNQQAGWDAAGAGGSLRPDSLLVSVLNRGASKLDRWLGVGADLATAPSQNDTDCTLRLTLENNVPADAPPYVLGPFEGVSVPEGTYLGIVAVTLPGDARDARIDGVDQLAVAGADGPTRVVGFQLQVAKGERREVVVHFRLPGRHGTMRVEPSARAPAMAWRSGETAWDDGASHRVTW
jgi:hypothetical protein